MGSTAGKTRVASVCIAVLLAVAAGAVRADDGAVRLLAEPTDFTNVIDAFEGDDLLDFDVHLAFVRSVESESIERELGGGGATGTPRYVHVVDSERTTSALVLGIDVGLFHDLMTYVRLPLVLSDTRSLSLAASGTCGSDPCPKVEALLRDVPSGGTGTSRRLFAPDFAAPTRSGVPAIDFGLAWGIVNQYDTPMSPTWLVSLETRVSVGDVMTPCESGTGCDPGISRGTARLLLQSRWSLRSRYLEPYLGVSYAYEWATAAQERFTPVVDLPGYVDPAPPSVVGAAVGVSVIPWEDRGRFQRLAIDVRAHGTHVSSGRDYSPLFDALGSSNSPHLTTPNSDRLTVASGADEQIPFTGLTQVAAHDALGVELAFAIQAAEYIRFRLGGGVTRSSTHVLTDAARCNTEARVGASDPRAGACAPHPWNPLYRPVIDLPGQRFRSGGSTTLELVAGATGQF